MFYNCGILKRMLLTSLLTSLLKKIHLVDRALLFVFWKDVIVFYKHECYYIVL